MNSGEVRQVRKGKVLRKQQEGFIPAGILQAGKRCYGHRTEEEG